MIELTEPVGLLLLGYIGFQLRKLEPMLAKVAEVCSELLVKYDGKQ